MDLIEHPRFVFAVILGCASVATSCGSNGREPLPDDAYGYADDPIPAGADVISEAEYDQLVDANNWEVVTLTRVADQEEAELDQDMADEETIAEAGETIPSDPPPSDDTVSPTADGNYLHTVTLPGNRMITVVTQGRRWFTRLLAGRIRSFPTRNNQLRLYEAIHDGLPQEWRGRLEFDLPSKVEFDSSKGAQDIREMIATVSSTGLGDSIIADLLEDFVVPPAFLEDCDQEVGAGTGGDLTDNDYENCGIRDDGLVSGRIAARNPYITCVKNQAGRGTCTGFANVSSIEMLVWSTHGARVNLSEQAYYNRARRFWAPGDYRDGLLSETGFKEMYNDGFLLYFEDQWNYNPSESRTGNDLTMTYMNSCVGYTETCSDTTHQSGFACTVDGSFVFCGYYIPEKNPDFSGYRIGKSAQFWDKSDRPLSLLLTKLLLAMGYPVVLGHPVTTAWDAAGTNGGVMPYRPNDTNKGGHGTHIVGFIENSTLLTLQDQAVVSSDIPQGAGGGYLIVKNSWSNCWGDGGFLYVPYQAVLDYAEDLTVLYKVL